MPMAAVDSTFDGGDLADVSFWGGDMTMATRHDFSDEQWGRIEGILGFSTSTKGNPRRDLRTMFHGIVWILRTGAPWRDLATYAPEPKPKTTMRKPGNQE